MNKPRQISVMLSSRSMSKVFDPQVTLASVRQKLQEQLNALRWTLPSGDGRPAWISTDPVFNVWLHEPETASTGSNTFELSLTRIQRDDIIIVLYNGEAGSAEGDSAIGICHAELQAALARPGGVVHIVELTPIAETMLQRDLNFRSFVDNLDLFHTKVANAAELLSKVLQLLQKAAAELVGRGARGKARRDRGQPLDWNRLDLDARRKTMRAALAVEMGALRSDISGEEMVEVDLAGSRFGARLDAIPAALSVAAARELVGQPFHRDHRFAAELSDACPGVVHVIACHRGVTEAQASRMLGSPDAIAIPSDFGVYAADHVQHIQLFLLANCADKSAIGVAVRRLNEWLGQTREIERVTHRAIARRHILQAVHTAGKLARGEGKDIGELKKRRAKKAPRMS